MFKKVIVAEDFGSTNQGIVQTLDEKLKIPTIAKEQYCDKAFNRIKIAQENNIPFELLITDISFKETPLIDRKYTSGIELIDAIQPIQPNIKIIVYSMDDNPTKIKSLFKRQKINGYVCKGRYGLKELVKAVQCTYDNEKYISPNVDQALHNNTFELDNFDLLILKELADGLNKKEIVEKLKSNKISPNSESTIEKRINRLSEHFEAKNTTNLIAKLIKKGHL
ncbi:DNA-binding response regulator [Aquimarina sp. M1]